MHSDEGIVLVVVYGFVGTSNLEARTRFRYLSNKMEDNLLEMQMIH